MHDLITAVVGLFELAWLIGFAMYSVFPWMFWAFIIIFVISWFGSR